MNTESDHLDAETLAAWLDNGLDDTSRAAAEAHASNCDRCQMLLATAAKTLPAASVLPGAAESGAMTRSWWKWLTPVAAAATAAVLWMIVPSETPPPSAPQQESKIAEARDAIAPAAPPSQAAPAAVAEEPAAKSKPLAAARKELPDAAPSENEARAVAADKAADTPGARENSLERADAAIAAAPQAPAAKATPPAPPAIAAEQRSEAFAGAAAQAQLRKQTAPAIEIVSPFPASRWRVAKDFLERSEDGGASWMPMRPVEPNQIRAGSSPSRFVCWLVGARGLVLLATDGTNFTRVRFPEQIDLATVIATSAAAAEITTADGRTFVTADAGRTWNPR